MAYQYQVILDINKDRLQVAEEVTHERCRQQNQQRRDAPEAHELGAGGVALHVVLVDVEREDRGPRGHHGSDV